MVFFFMYSVNLSIKWIFSMPLTHSLDCSTLYLMFLHYNSMKADNSHLINNAKTPFSNTHKLNRFWMNYIRKALCIFHSCMQWNENLKGIASRRRRKKESEDWKKILLIWSQCKDTPPISFPPDFGAESFPSPP